MVKANLLLCNVLQAVGLVCLVYIHISAPATSCIFSNKDNNISIFQALIKSPATTKSNHV